MRAVCGARVIELAPRCVVLQFGDGPASGIRGRTAGPSFLNIRRPWPWRLMVGPVDDPDQNVEGRMAAGSCRACGLELREGARYCDGCGAPATGESEPAEYKQVTILFADVVRSMDIAARVGPERLREIMSALVSRSAEVIERNGGILNNYTGDGLMALFGAPVALEDHTFRACLAAIDIQRAAQELAPEVLRRDGVTLQLRIGINSGQVITGEIGSRAAGYTAVGDQVGMAQRMESVAPPGGVMLSEASARLVDGVAELGDPELVRIKGGGSDRLTVRGPPVG